METLLLVLLAIVAPYPVAGLMFGTLLAFAFYAAVIVAALVRLTGGSAIGKA